MKEVFDGLVRSKIFWAGFVSFALIVVRAFRPDFALTDQQVTEIVVAVVGLVLGSEIKAQRVEAQKQTELIKQQMIGVSASQWVPKE